LAGVGILASGEERKPDKIPTGNFETEDHSELITRAPALLDVRAAQ
jgi:hypothetical protein